MEGDVGPQRRRQAAYALAPPSPRQDERLGLAPHLICLAVGTDERGAPGWLETLAKPLRRNRPRPAMGDGLSLYE